MEEVLKPTPNPEEISLLSGLEKLRQSIVEYSLRSHTLRKIPKFYPISWSGNFVCCEVDISFIWGKYQVRDHHKLSFFDYYTRRFVKTLTANKMLMFNF